MNDARAKIQSLSAECVSQLEKETERRGIMPLDFKGYLGFLVTSEEGLVEALGYATSMKRDGVGVPWIWTDTTRANTGLSIDGVLDTVERYGYLAGVQAVVDDIERVSDDQHMRGCDLRVYPTSNFRFYQSEDTLTQKGKSFEARINSMSSMMRQNFLR